MIRLRFWRTLESWCHRLGFHKLGKRARTRRFRAQLAQQKLDVAKIQSKSGPSDDTEASSEQGITPTSVKRPRRAKPPKRVQA